MHFTIGYQSCQSVIIEIEPELVRIISFPGIDRSVPKEVIERGERFSSRYYRNKRLGEFLKELEFFSEKYNVQVVTYGSKLKLSFIKNVKQAGPREFINLIKNAWYIVTDSFHCVAFSLIYKNNFIAVKNEINKNTISRIETLVSYIKSETYLINQDELHSYSFIPVDYSGYDELLSIVEDSKNYLKEALHE